ncbi:MAG: CPBP family intramembrane metalloprotease [Pirellulales bacterium]|nr:CPBP family intramembrane metalloprotease [Pirellulales bacterium]
MNPDSIEPLPERELSPWVMIALEGALLPMALLAGWLFEIDPCADIVWSADSLALGVVTALLPLAVVLALDYFRPALWQGMTHTIDELLIPLLRHWSWGQLLLVSLLAGLGEELLFRGVMIPALVPWIGLGAAVALSSILFGAVHAITRLYIVYATLMGLYLAFVWLASENLAVPIVAHAAYDFVALAWFLRWRGDHASSA